MAKLFGKRKLNAEPPTSVAIESSSSSSSSNAPSDHPPLSSSSSTTSAIYSNSSSSSSSSSSSLITTTFASLGLSSPLCKTISSLSLKSPTSIQKQAIPSILSGANIIAISSTGSGKTAAFALPIIEKLSRDPYGIYALILSPTRELAGQIREQIAAFGSSFSLNVELIVGGGDMVHQSLSINKKPHFIVATPGRMMEHIKGPTPPTFKGLRFLVLDEADRLLTKRSGFEADIASIVRACFKGSQSCQTLLFSATMSEGLDEVVRRVTGMGRGGRIMRFERIVVDEGNRYAKEKKDEDDEEGDDDNSDEGEGTSKKQKLTTTAAAAAATTGPRIPSGLKQQYIFMPHKLRDVYLVATIRHLVLNGGMKATTDDDGEILEGSGWTLKNGVVTDPDDDAEGNITGANGLARSCVVFVGTCERAAYMEGTFRELGIDCAALHSLLTQDRRNAALGKFKSQQVRILIATDVASRGLDIPEVDLVVNAELPRRGDDYIHRVGRTARAGRRGLAVSLVGEEDISLIHEAERISGREMTKCTRITDKDAVKLMNPVSKASRLTKVRLSEVGFEELVKKRATRRLKDKSMRDKLAKKFEKKESKSKAKGKDR